MAYISCDYIATKWSGRLYEVVIKSERCDPHELVMIGDNFKSDVVKAKEKGFSSFLFERDN